MRRASRPDRWLDPARGPEPPPAHEPLPQVEQAPDRGLTFAYGQHWRSERSVARGDPDNTITSAEQKVLRQRRLEEAEDRQARKDANFAAALRLGAVLKGKG